MFNEDGDCAVVACGVNRTLLFPLPSETTVAVVVVAIDGDVIS